jgi:N6-L-threonylcarbamoyladenine synthase
MKIVLGIESSCDETAAAVVRDDGLVLSNVVHSQIALHQPYGGIIPELASRDHLQNIARVVEQALTEASLDLSAINAIAATVQPGLVGALLVGAQFAKSLAWSRRLPFVAVDHLVGHLLAADLHRLDDVPKHLPLPFLALLVSGGNTALYRVNDKESAGIIELGATRDDAAGEAFDKIGKLLGLPYPAGPHIDAISAAWRERKAKGAVALPCRLAPSKLPGLEFSFSGLKSQAARLLADSPCTTDEDLGAFCDELQSTIVDELVKKLMRAARQEGLQDVVLAGGVAANSALRAATTAAAMERGLTAHLPARWCCTDNAAMIAYAGAKRLGAGIEDAYAHPVASDTRIVRNTRKGRGPRAGLTERTRT